MNHIMSLTLQDKNYVRSEIKTALAASNIKLRKEIKKDFEHHTGIILDEFRSQIKLITELIDTRPTREEINQRFDSIESNITMLDMRISHS
jgi:hypothetical protein